MYIVCLFFIVGIILLIYNFSLKQKTFICYIISLVYANVCSPPRIKLILFRTFQVLFVKLKVGSFLWPMNSKFLTLIDASHVSPKLFQTSTSNPVKTEAVNPSLCVSLFLCFQTVCVSNKTRFECP